MATLLLDSASLYYRSFFALPESITAPDGMPVNAVRGFLDTVAAIIRDRGHQRVIACWDEDWRPAWRVDLLPDYKTHRLAEDSDGEEEEPDTLGPQISVLRRLLPALGMPIAGAPDAEADDVIATLAITLPGAVDIASGDRDLVQLVDDRVTMLYTGGSSASRGGASWEIITPATAQEKFGVAPHQYADLAVLRGDPSDGLPGVRGVGPKTAGALVAAFGDLESILAAAADPATGRPMTATVRARLLESADYLRRADAVVRLSAADWIPEPSFPETDGVEGLAMAADYGVLSAATRLHDELRQARSRR